MNINFNGYGENVATFLASSAVKEGDFVIMGENNYQVVPATANAELFGKCLSVRDGYAAVMTSGYIETPYEGEITLGLCGIVTASADKAAYSANAEKHKVIYIDDDKVGFIL